MFCKFSKLLAKEINVDDLSIQLALAFTPVKTELDPETQEPIEPAMVEIVSSEPDAVADTGKGSARKRRRILTRRESWIN